MESRMEKYYRKDLSEYSRSKKNADLYKKVYGNYGNFEHLPVSDNFSEIDINALNNMVSSREDYQKARAVEEITNGSIKIKTMEEKEEKIIPERKIYDINELIEKARNENAKAKEMMKNNTQKYNFLHTLESSSLPKEINKVITKEENLATSENKQNMSTSASLSLEILSDLKPSGNTVVMDPINENKKSSTSDIPIDKTFIKEEKNNSLEENKVSFYSGSYTFSKKDFFDDDEFKINNNHTFLKVILILLGIILLGVLTYICIIYFGIKNA